MCVYLMYLMYELGFIPTEYYLVFCLERPKYDLLNPTIYVGRGPILSEFKPV